MTGKDLVPVGAGGSLPSVNQAGAIAGQDVVAGNKHVVVHNHASAERSLTVVEQLLNKLQTEIEQNTQLCETLDSLKHYYNRKSHDGIRGLEAKLLKAGREHETNSALEKKEQFVKLLDRFSLYASAQEIFVYLLARAEHEFSMSVMPQLASLQEHEINGVISTKIVNPVVEDCGATLFQMNHATAMGMLYWLAEQCFVRWHQ